MACCARHIDCDDRASFGCAIAFEHGDAQRFIEFAGAALEAFGAGHHKAQRRKILRLSDAVKLMQKRVGREHDGRFVRPQELQVLLVTQWRKANDGMHAVEKRKQRAGR